MAGSVESATAAALGLQNWMAMQEKDNLLLRKVLDNQAATIQNLVDSVPKAPQLASSGTVGTLLHEIA